MPGTKQANGKSLRGFAAMDENKRREAARKGGQTSRSTKRSAASTARTTSGTQSK